MSGDNSTKPWSSIADNSWNTALIVCEVINLVILFVTLWVLLCLIVYGIKAGKWTKKPGTSSLNSGMVYSTCVLAVAVSTTRLVASEVIYRLPGIKDGLSYCELVGDIALVSYAITSYSTYLFLCIRQRLIYTHPYAKPHVGRLADILSKAYFIFITAIVILIACLYAIPSSYKGSSYGCVLITFRSPATIAALAAAFITAQISMLCLSIYPAVRVGTDTQDDDKSTSSKGRSSSSSSFRNRHESLMSSGRRALRSVSDNPTNPVQMAIRRTLISTVVMVVSDVLAVCIDALVLPLSAPIVFAYLIFEVSTLINVFCMVSAFGFAGRVLTLFFPTCPRTESASSDSVWLETHS